jgi:hypothetical protein
MSQHFTGRIGGKFYMFSSGTRLAEAIAWAEDPKNDVSLFGKHFPDAEERPDDSPSPTSPEEPNT